MRSAECGVNGNGKGKDLNRKERQERKERQRLSLWNEKAAMPFLRAGEPTL
jgi:hypothetical protein